MKSAPDIDQRDLKPDNERVSITWTSEIDDARLLRVAKILDGILSTPVDVVGTPGDGGRR